MLLGSVWSYFSDFRESLRLINRRGRRLPLYFLPVLIFILGGYISMNAREVSSPEAPELWQFKGMESMVLGRDGSVLSQAKDLIRYILEQDYLMALIGGKKLVRADFFAPDPVEQLSSTELARLYMHRESTAFISDRKLILTETVLRVRRDDFASATLEFPGVEGLQVLARLQGDSASLSAGDTVTMYCSVNAKDGSGKASGLYLRECAEIDVIWDAWAYCDHLSEASRGWLRRLGLLVRNGEHQLSLR